MNMKYLLTLTLFLLPLVSLAAEGVYTPLVNLPGIESTTNFNDYINSIYGLSIVIAALLAVIKITIAGVKWMLTDVVTSKEDAKRDIKGSLLGLLVILAAVLIISVINKDILNVDLKFSALPRPDSPGIKTITLPSGHLTTVKPSDVLKEINVCFNNPSKPNDCADKKFVCKKLGGTVTKTHSNYATLSKSWAWDLVPFYEYECKNFGCADLNKAFYCKY